MQIVAPAGSLSGLRASINGGADAVYLGMPQFGARAKAQNFDDTALKQAVGFAHLFGVKVFVTLNTLIKDSELDAALSAARLAYETGADAAIVQDIRFIKLLKREIPDFVLHASTQMGIHNRDGAAKLLDLGIRRAVLSRETLPEDIRAVKSTGIEIEYFVQGALCIAFSGNCYFSSLASSYSGNRGKCMQLCRKPYTFRGNKGYHLSAKDICLYDKLSELENLGVDAIKIEGRMRSDEYAYTATSVYRSDMPIADAVSRLKSVFNRGDYCSAYLDADAPFRVVYDKMQSNIGIPIGKIDKVRGNKIHVAGYAANPLDGFKVLRGGREICGGSVRGGEITVDGNCKQGDELRRTFDGALTEKVKSARRAIPVSVRVDLKAGEPPQATLYANGLFVTVCGEEAALPARTRAITADDIARVFGRVSEYPFEPAVDSRICGEIFMPVSALNELRRTAYRALSDKLLRAYPIKRSTDTYKGLIYNKFAGSGKILMVESGEDLTEKTVAAVDYVALNPRNYGDFTVPRINKPILLNLPVTMRGKDRDVILSAIARDGIYGVISNNMYTLNITDKPVLLGIGHNIIGHCDLPHIRSYEADSLPQNTDGVFIYAFGYAPLMTLCHCPYGKCVNCSGRDMLTDEAGRKFALRKYSAAHCYWQLLNCVPHSLQKKAGANIFLDCTELNAAQTEQVVLLGEYDGQYTVGNVNKGLK
ncbi:MAG: U32 family peptidase [Clostridia bacterium]|nr:U32 family peptidase [Clostridia bacterium]